MSEKEKFGFSPETGKKSVEITDVESIKNERLPNEVVDWMQRVETNNFQSNLMNDLANQQPSQAQTTTPISTTKLPASRAVFLSGFKATVQEAHRWLSEFLLRTIKIKKGNVTFKEE